MFNIQKSPIWALAFTITPAIITTPVGSIQSFVNNENGYVVELEGFKSAMLEVINNYDKAMIKANKLNKYVVSNLNIKRIVHKYEVLYESVLK